MLLDKVVDIFLTVSDNLANFYLIRALLIGFAEKAKRFELPFTSDPMPQQWNYGLSQGALFGQGQLPDEESAFSLSPNQMLSDDSSFTGQNKVMSSSPEQLNVQNEMLGDVTNRNELGTNSLSIPQGQYNSAVPQSSEKVEFYEPNETGSPETPPYLDSPYTDTGPSKEDLQKIEPLLESEKFLANAIIKDTWREGELLFWTHFLKNVNSDDWKPNYYCEAVSTMM